MHEENSREYWWNVSVKTAMKVPQNKPDPMIWNHETKICSILEFCCLLCIYINIKVNEKLENYGPLFRNLQIMYPKYKFQVATIVIDTMGYVPKCWINYLEIIVFNENDSKVLISKL